MIDSGTKYESPLLSARNQLPGKSSVDQKRESSG